MAQNIGDYTEIQKKNPGRLNKNGSMKREIERMNITAEAGMHKRIGKNGTNKPKGCI